MDTPSYYAIIPASVRYDPKLSAQEKLLYGEITALSSKEGYCWASNAYFANLYKVNPTTVSGWISSLQAAGYISVNVDRAAGNKRKLWMHPSSGKAEDPSSGKAEDPSSGKAEDNNTRIITTSLNKPVDGHKALVDLYFELHKAKYGEKPLFGSAEGKLLQRLLNNVSVEDVERKLRSYYRATFWFNKESHDFRQFSAHYNEIVAKADPWQDPSRFVMGDDEAARQDMIVQELGL